VASAYGFAEQLLASQRNFAEDLADSRRALSTTSIMMGCT
jgi:hypothetical protein